MNLKLLDLACQTTVKKLSGLVMAVSVIGVPKNRTDTGYLDKPTWKPTSVFNKPKNRQKKPIISDISVFINSQW